MKKKQRHIVIKKKKRGERRKGRGERGKRRGRDTSQINNITRLM